MRKLFVKILRIMPFKSAQGLNSDLIPLIIFIVSLLWCGYYLFPSLVNKYSVNNDTLLHISWMNKFCDSGLFSGDLLAQYPKYFAPWGFIIFYRLAALFFEPLLIAKILPVFLFALSAMYMFKLVKEVSRDSFSSLLAVLFFCMAPCFLGRIVGGNARAFGYLLLIAFLYYLIKNKIFPASVILILQCLLYPMIFLISSLAYGLSFIKSNNKKNMAFMGIVLIICLSVLMGKHYFNKDDNVGKLVGRQEMLNNPAFYSGGRTPRLPLLPLLSVADMNFKMGVVNEKAVIKLINAYQMFVIKLINSYQMSVIKLLNLYHEVGFKMGLNFKQISIRISGDDDLVVMTPAGKAFSYFFYCVILLLLIEIIIRRFFIPAEIFYIVIAGMFFYKIADFLLPKLFLPTRYIEYSLRIIGVVLFCTGVGRIVSYIKTRILRIIFQIFIFFIVIFAYCDLNKNNGLMDLSDNQRLYEYAALLPKDALIAAHPRLADGIPLFSKRKVFLNYETSLPFLDKYWQVITKRTRDFFKAYYSDNLLDVYKFCLENKIDYLIVDTNNFSREYLDKGKIYFEPFNTYIKDTIKGKREGFALVNIRPEDKCFIDKGIFILDVNRLGKNLNAY